MCCCLSVGHTEERLGAAVLLDDLDDTGLELLNGGNVVGEDTHLTRLGGDVDLDDVLRLEDGLPAAVSMRCYKFSQHRDGAPKRKSRSSSAIGSHNSVRSVWSTLRRHFERGRVIPGEAETGSA